MKKILIILLGLIFLFPGVVCAHRVHISSRIKEVGIKSWYGGGDPIRGGEVKIHILKNGAEELYLEGLTNENGEYSFPHKIGVNAYRVEVESTRLPGHRTETIVNMTTMQSGKGGNGGCAELPPYQGVIAGIGYLLGLAGIAMIYLAKKQNA